MSLVEQALKKAKQTGQPVPLSTQAPAPAEQAAPTPLEAALPPAKAMVEGGDISSVIEPSPEITSTVQPLHLVAIDRESLRADGYLPPVEQEREIAEQFRHVKRPLVSRALGRGQERVPHGNRIAVMSALQGEGKTFTAINLALSIAMEMDKRVLLVDADVAQPSIPHRLGLTPGKGLLDLLSDPAVALSECLLRTNIEKFSVLPAGTPHARATELLASDAMSRLVAELTSRYPDRVVIFDSPPLLASSESRVLATNLGQVLFVVEADRTAQSTISEALATIEACPVVMTVLNKARRTADAPYGYRH